MAQVVLVYPAGGFAPKSPPLGVLHLAAMLQQADLSVAVIDASVDAGYRERLVDVVDGGTECVGVNPPTIRSSSSRRRAWPRSS